MDRTTGRGEYVIWGLSDEDKAGNLIGIPVEFGQQATGRSAAKIGSADGFRRHVASFDTDTGTDLIRCFPVAPQEFVMNASGLCGNSTSHTRDPNP